MLKFAAQSPACGSGSWNLLMTARAPSSGSSMRGFLTVFWRLDVLEDAQRPEDMDVPGFNFRP